MIKNYLKEIRKNKGISQAKLFGMTGIWPSIISLIENGYYDPPEEKKKKICKELGIELLKVFPKNK